MIKAKPWNGKDLKGTWEVTLKIDGVRALWKTGPLSKDDPRWYSRADKPLYNLPAWTPGMPTDCEVYLGSFKDTIRATRSKNPKLRDGCKLKRCRCAAQGITGTDTIGGQRCPSWEFATPVITQEHLYSLDPLDKRLQFRSIPFFVEGADGVTLRASDIRRFLELALQKGFEGLVLRQGDKWLKVKPEETHDVLITGAVEGAGKHKGRLGALVTAKGEVGTGFSDEERTNLWLWHVTGHNGIGDVPLIGQTIEVSCMHFTPDGKFRHPRFVRMRPDKIAEE